MDKMNYQQTVCYMVFGVTVSTLKHWATYMCSRLAQKKMSLGHVLLNKLILFVFLFFFNEPIKRPQIFCTYLTIAKSRKICFGKPYQGICIRV